MGSVTDKKWAVKCGNIFVLFALWINGWLFFYSPLTIEAAEKKRWQLQPTLHFYEQYDDNVDLLPENQVSSYITELGLGLTAVLPSSRRQIKVDTNLKMDYRNRSDGEVETLHWLSLYGYVGYQASPRLTYEVGGSYDLTYTQDNLTVPLVNSLSALTQAQLIEVKPGVSYSLTKNTNIKGGLLYGSQLYKGDDGVDGTDYGLNFTWDQRVGSRIRFNLGLEFVKKDYSNETGYTRYDIPGTIYLDLTYLQLQISGGYQSYSFENPDVASIGTEDIGSFSKFVYGINFDLGGQLLRLKATTISFAYKTNTYDDLYGQPYVNSEFSINIFHAYKKYDVYADIKYGKDVYIAAEDRRSYMGGNIGVRWYIDEESYMNFTGDYTIYKYEPEGSKFNVLQGNIDYNRNIYEWLFAGGSYAFRSSAGNTTEGDYLENIYSLYLKTSW